MPDLARELGRRLGVEVEFTGYESPGKVADAASTGVWDVAFLGAKTGGNNLDVLQLGADLAPAAAQLTRGVGPNAHGLSCKLMKSG